MMLRRYHAKYSKAADRTKIVEEAKENDYSTLPTDELKNIKNDDLKAYLDRKGVDYASDAVKKDLVELIAGK